MTTNPISSNQAQLPVPNDFNSQNVGQIASATGASGSGSGGQSALKAALQRSREIDEALEKELNLVYPPNLDVYEKGLWFEFFYLLKLGYGEKLVLKEDMKAFQEAFYQMTLEQKEQYLTQLDEELNSKIKSKGIVLEEIQRMKTEDIIEEEKQKLPKEIQPAFEYIVYSVLAGQEIPQKDMDGIEQYLLAYQQQEEFNNLSLEEKEAIQAFNLQRTVQDIRRKPFRVAEGEEVQFNSAFSAEQIAKIVNRDQENDHYSNLGTDLDGDQNVSTTGSFSQVSETADIPEKLPSGEVRVRSKPKPKFNTTPNSPFSQTINNPQYQHLNNPNIPQTAFNPAMPASRPIPNQPNQQYSSAQLPANNMQNRRPNMSAANQLPTQSFNRNSQKPRGLDELLH